MEPWTLDSMRRFQRDRDVESVELDGGFRPGAREVTVSTSSGRIEWRIAEVGDGTAVIAFDAPALGGVPLDICRRGQRDQNHAAASMAGERAWIM